MMEYLESCSLICLIKLIPWIEVSWSKYHHYNEVKFKSIKMRQIWRHQTRPKQNIDSLPFTNTCMTKPFLYVIFKSCRAYSIEIACAIRQSPTLLPNLKISSSGSHLSCINTNGRGITQSVTHFNYSVIEVMNLSVFLKITLLLT